MSRVLTPAAVAEARQRVTHPARWEGALRRLGASAWLAVLSCGVMLVGCPGPEPSVAPTPLPPPPRAEPVGPRVELFYSALDGSPITTDRLLHRVTVVGLIATYDPASQTQAIYLRELARRHTPRINVLLLVLEPPENLPMVQAFADVLDAPFPVALADEATIAGQGPFGELRGVPSLVVLTRDGREAWRHVGQVDPATLDRVLRSLEGGSAKGDAGARDGVPSATDAREPDIDTDEGR